MVDLRLKSLILFDLFGCLWAVGCDEQGTKSAYSLVDLTARPLLTGNQGCTGSNKSSCELHACGRGSKEEVVYVKREEKRKEEELHLNKNYLGRSRDKERKMRKSERESEIAPQSTQ